MTLATTSGGGAARSRRDRPGLPPQLV